MNFIVICKQNFKTEINLKFFHFFFGEKGALTSKRNYIAIALQNIRKGTIN